MFLTKSDINIEDGILCKLKEIKQNEFGFIQNETTKYLIRYFGNIPLEMSYLEGLGTFNHLFLIKIQAKKYIVKVESLPFRGLLNGLAREKLILENLKNYSVNFAKLNNYSLDDNNSFFLLMMEFIQNESLFSLIQKKVKINKEILNLGIKLRDLHDIDIQIKNFGIIDVKTSCAGVMKGSFDTWYEFLTHNLDLHLDICIQNQLINQKQKIFFKEIFYRNKKIFNINKKSVLHGDLSNKNIFFDYNYLPKLIDWEDALIGDPLFDIANWASFVGNEKYFKFLINGYFKDHDDYCEEKELLINVYLIRILLAKTVHRFRFGFIINDKIPSTKRFENPIKNIKKIL